MMYFLEICEEGGMSLVDAFLYLRLTLVGNYSHSLDCISMWSYRLLVRLEGEESRGYEGEGEEKGE